MIVVVGDGDGFVGPPHPADATAHAAASADTARSRRVVRGLPVIPALISSQSVRPVKHDRNRPTEHVVRAGLRDIVDMLKFGKFKPLTP